MSFKKYSNSLREFGHEFKDHYLNIKKTKN